MGITKETRGSLLLKGVLGLEINEVIRGITTSSLYSMKIKKARKIANLSLGHLLRGVLTPVLTFVTMPWSVSFSCSVCSRMDVADDHERNPIQWKMNV